MKTRKAKVGRADASFQEQGVDHGGPGTVVAWNRKDGFITVRFEGGKVWSGRGQQSYAPTRFATYKAEWQGEGEEHILLEVERIIEHDLRAKAIKVVKP